MKSNGNGLRLYAILYLAFLYAPIILLPLFAFNDGTIIAFPLKGFSTKWFEAMAEDGVLKGAVINSLIVGSCTAILSTTLALLAARASHGDPVDDAGASGRPRLDPVRVQGQGRHHGPHHDAPDPAGNRHGHGDPRRHPSGLR